MLANRRQRLQKAHYDPKFHGVDLDGRVAEAKKHAGVMPDEVAKPIAQDLAAPRDPVPAHAVEALGVKFTPGRGGKAFPYEWPPEN